MYTYIVSVFYLGKLVDEIQVSAANALEACNQVQEMSKEFMAGWNSHELQARRVMPALPKDAGGQYTYQTYKTYFGDWVTQQEVVHA